MKLLSTAILITACFLTSSVFAQSVDEWLSKGKELLTDQSDSKEKNKDGNPDISDLDINNGLKQALQQGAELVVSQLGQTGGFTDDPKIHIPLPNYLNNLTSGLKQLGYDSWINELELKLNSAAEQASPHAKQLFVKAIEKMEISDLEKIYRGEDDAATQYFKAEMSAPLAETFRPIINESLAEVGAIALYDNMIKEYQSIPFVPDIKGDLSNYVVDESLEGIFYYLAIEEAAIRKDPVKQTTELLKKLFSP